MPLISDLGVLSHEPSRPGCTKLFREVLLQAAARNTFSLSPYRPLVASLETGYKATVSSASSEVMMRHSCLRSTPQRPVSHPSAAAILTSASCKPGCSSARRMNKYAARTLDHNHAGHSLLIARFQGQTVEAPSQFEHLPYDCTELLDLHGKQSYLLCDITKAFDRLVSLDTLEGYSAEAMDGRVEVLNMLKESALLQDGKVQQDKGLDLPSRLVPSALALLAQIGENACVYELAHKALADDTLSETSRRDITLSLVAAHCNAARDLFQEEKVAEGCNVLEQSLILLHSAGSPPLAPGLAANIQESLDSLKVQRILDQFVTNADGPHAAAERQRAVGLLHGLLASSSSAPAHGLRGLFGSSPEAQAAADGVAAAAGVTPEFISQIVQQLSCAELMAMADWDRVASRASSTSWLFPGLLQHVACAHIAAAVTQERVSAAETALSLLTAGPTTCEALLLKSVAHVLLGDFKAASAAIKASARAPADPHVVWPDMRPVDIPEGGELPLVLPPAAYAYDFVLAHSQPDDDQDLVTGLYCYAELVLQQVVLAGFNDTADLQGTCSLTAYYDNPSVQQELALLQDKHSATLAGNLTAVKDAVLSMQPLVQQLAQTAGSKLSAGSTQASALTARLASQLSTDSPEGAKLVDGLRDAAASAGAAVDGLAGGRLAQLTARVGGPLPAAAAGVAVLAAAFLATSLGRSGARSTNPQHQPLTMQVSQQGEASVASTVRPLTKADAAQLLKRFQGAKAAALGSNFDASKLPDVCLGPALARFQSMSQDWASKGWFRTATVWKCDVQRVQPQSSSGLRVLVTARIGEKAETWGIDGQRGSSWSNEYDVDYDVVLCRDMQWRIERVTVRGQEPGMPGWFGGLFGGGK